MKRPARDASAPSRVEIVDAVLDDSLDRFAAHLFGQGLSFVEPAQDSGLPESINETPSGMLLHGIMSTIAEFYSRNLANEVTKGMTQKAATGGTVGHAPLG